MVDKHFFKLYFLEYGTGYIYSATAERLCVVLLSGRSARFFRDAADRGRFFDVRSRWHSPGRSVAGRFDTVATDRVTGIDSGGSLPSAPRLATDRARSPHIVKAEYPDIAFFPQFFQK